MRYRLILIRAFLKDPTQLKIAYLICRLNLYYSTFLFAFLWPVCSHASRSGAAVRRLTSAGAVTVAVYGLPDLVDSCNYTDEEKRLLCRGSSVGGGPPGEPAASPAAAAASPRPFMTAILDALDCSQNDYTALFALCLLHAIGNNKGEHWGPDGHGEVGWCGGYWVWLDLVGPAVKKYGLVSSCVLLS